MVDEKLHETTLSTKEIYGGKVVHVQECSVRLPSGQESIREVVRHPGAVAILAEQSDGKLLLVRQYRFPTGQVLVEIPAGKLEPGEQPEVCAMRELEEETGFKANAVHPVYSFFTSPGFADEKIELYYATDLTAGNVRLDDDEFVDVQTVDRDELRQMLASGEINDAKTIIGALWWLQQGVHLL